MNTRLIEASDSDPLQDQRNALARTAAVLAAEAIAPAALAASVSYRSAGKTLIVGSAAQALPWAERLAGALAVTVLLADGDATLVHGNYPVHPAQAIALTGWLGAFDAHWQAAGVAPQEGRFDLVLDLCASPLIGSHQRPNGYYAPGPDEAARLAAVDELLQMVGEFEKPKYFSYKEKLCAHSRNRQTGCNACIDICSARAIEGAGDRIKVNPYLCAGCGACSTVCPTGAISYNYPSAAHTGSRIKAALRAYAEAGGRHAALLLHSAGEGAELLARTGGVPGRIVPFALQHTASTGIELWFSALAYGASGVTVLMTGAEAPQYLAAIDRQMEIAQTVMDALGYEGPHFQLLHVNTPDELELALRCAPRGAVPQRPASFNLAAEKRNTLDYALAHLHQHAPLQPPGVALPQGAPFGAIGVDRKACTLCMSCVGACPAGALMDGQNLPQLRFIEQNCVQCGLCANTCPEDAITLLPHLSFAPERSEAVVMNETQPFHCIRCNQAFGTVLMIENMLGRLAQHPAFAGKLDRIRMCGDCRVIDMMTPQDEMTIITLRRQ